MLAFEVGYMFNHRIDTFMFSCFPDVFLALTLWKYYILFLKIPEYDSIFYVQRVLICKSLAILFFAMKTQNHP